MSTATLLVGADLASVEALRAGLDAELVSVPSATDLAALAAPVGAVDALDWPWAESLDAWRAEAIAGPSADRVVVAAWPEDDVVDAGPASLADVDLQAWLARGEVPLGRWFAALGVAARRCADGGSIVAVIERPPPLDSAGWGPESGVADAVEALVRSLARAEGCRGVRVNAVTTPVRLHRPPVVDPAPSLAAFPGSVDQEVLGAVRMLLCADAVGVTGTVVNADCGRSWR